MQNLYYKIMIAILGVVIVFSLVDRAHSHSAIDVHGTTGARHQVISLTDPEYTKNLNELVDIANTQDPHTAMEELIKRSKTNEIVFSNCHSIAHKIGRTAYERYQDFNVALQYQDSFCSDGYLHGVIEGKFTHLADTQSAIAEIKTICGYKYADRCWHGVGHGLMFFTKDDLPRSLSICDTYALSRAQRRCYEGVFMENFLSDPSSHPSDYVDPNNPFVPCPTQLGRYKAVCYFYAPTYFLGLHHDDYEGALKWCQSAESPYSSSCIRGVGSLAMKYHIDSPSYAEQLCMHAPGSHIRSCIDGMVSYYLTFSGSFSATANLCKQLQPTSIDMCNTTVKNNIRVFQD